MWTGWKGVLASISKEPDQRAAEEDCEPDDEPISDVRPKHLEDSVEEDAELLVGRERRLPRHIRT